MPKIKIKRVGLDDINALVDVSQRTFIKTFAEHNIAEDMHLYLSRNMSDGNIKAELENESSEFYFITVDNDVAGYLKITYNSGVDGLDESTNVEIERIYILKDYQQLGLGRKLLEKAVTISREAGYDYIWLGVWEHNKNAIDFYKHLGFESFGKQPFQLGNDLQTDIRMKFKLSQYSGW